MAKKGRPTKYTAELAAGAVRNLLGSKYRVRWFLRDNDDASFTFSVQADVM